MSLKSTFVVIGLLATGSNSLHAQEQGDVLVQRGETKLTLSDVDGRMSRLGADERPAYAQRPENLSRLMDQLLTNRQLAIEARELKLDQQANVKRDLELAVEEVLAIHRLNALAENAPAPDLEQLAKERYQANQSEFKVPEQRVVEHILIGNESRSDEEAMTLAQEVRVEAMGDGADFVALVEKYSDDPGKTQNQGRYTVSRPGQFVPEFEAASKALTKPGDITEPVKTRFGYHLIRLVEIQPERLLAFEEVRGKLVDEARKEYYKSLRTSHLSNLRGQKETGNEPLLLSLPERYGGRPDLPAGSLPSTTR